MRDVTIPLKLISLLADGEFHSGEQFGAVLGMSRAAINKHIQTVCDWGVDVFTVPGKGYRLYAPLQLLDESVIRARLPAGRLAVLPVIDSTNQYLIERIGIALPGDACVAEYQAQGRGRRGRQWISLFGNNLYLSLYWRLEQGPAAAGGLSLMVGIVMAEVLQRLGAKWVRVKWPNDLYLNDRKLAGILVEISGKAGDAAHVVIGAGINLAMREGAAGKIDQGWINLQEAGIAIDRNALAAELTDTLRQALRQFECDGFAPFVARWQALDNFFDRPVKLLIGEREIKGTARGIDAQGALLLEQEGKLHAYLGGEISLRGQ
ncbi:biotin--[acetyl-CoA-carboxylase] synthetase [Sodalis-like symbiont of Philaenus spumarius]|nr:biotin--[acetyl-CoA-carboxylase] synthetase [Sodalis-like symbiont of Philaenus spumarius]